MTDRDAPREAPPKDERVRPFSNGSEFGDWQSSNCRQCAFGHLDQDADVNRDCPLEYGLGVAYLLDGKMSAKAARLIGRHPDNESFACTVRHHKNDTPVDVAAGIAAITAKLSEREYRDVIDKSEWPRGEWDAEPDKVQWVDAATGLDCLAVRGPSGAWCGYVGVPEGHPYFEVGYSDCTKKPACGEPYCGHSPDVDVHGGLTFASHSHEPTRESWEKWRTGLRARASDAEKYPKGDTARAFKDEGKYLDDYEAWAIYRQSRGICRAPEEGRPTNVWWFGFDCAHSGDLSDMAYRHVLGERFSHDGYDEYRTLHYVQREVGSLARQLSAVTVQA